MSVFKRIDQHARLLHAMAGTVDFDFDERIQTAKMTPDDMGQMFRRCLTCREGTACGQWLGEHPKGADAPPAYCKNAGEFKKAKDA